MAGESEMSEVTLAVLAGGRGSRMGQPKGTLQLHGRSILSHILAEANWPGPTLLVTSPGFEHPTDCQLFNREVSDPIAGQGPLRGILTAAQQASTSIILVLPVDMPCFGHACLCQLASKLIQRPTIDVVMFRTNRSAKTEVEPLPIALHTRAIPTVDNQLASGRRSVSALETHTNTILVDAPSDWPESVWTNLNDPDELRRYLTGII